MSGFSDQLRAAAERIRLRHLVTVAVVLLVGFAVGMVAERTTASLPERCVEALRAADAVVAAVDRQWETASAAVDAAQKAVDRSGYRHLAAACRE